MPSVGILEHQVHFSMHTGLPWQTALACNLCSTSRLSMAIAMELAEIYFYIYICILPYPSYQQNENIAGIHVPASYFHFSLTQ